MIVFECSACTKGLRVKPDLAGKKVRCPQFCRSAFRHKYDPGAHDRYYGLRVCFCLEPQTIPKEKEPQTRPPDTDAQPKVPT